MNFDGRILTMQQLHEHVQGLQFSGSFQPKFPVLHNTSVPDLKTYQGWIASGRPTMEQWLRNLASYYAGLGWNSMPHAFVLPDGRVGLGAPFNVKGTHSPSWNSVSIGVETLGEFERDIWAGTPTEQAAVALFGELCLKLNWQPDVYARGVRGIHFHKEDPHTTHRTCPGKNVDKSRFVSMVLQYMGVSAAAHELDRNDHVEPPLPVHTSDASALTKDQLTSSTWLQQRLVAHGFDLRVDGIVGGQTKNAVKAFQQANPPLVVDGIAGPLTRLKLSE